MIIPHHRGNYPVRFRGLREILADCAGEHLIMADATVAGLYDLGDAVQIAPGESSKSLRVYGELLRELARRRASRQTVLVAVGGGVTGDLVGFVAATYLRGVPFRQVPTTLLAMVDSSVGGKVAIDLPEGKNLVGAFYPPIAVDIPLETLSTLPDREYRSGAAEVLKYGLIQDEEFWAWLREPILPCDERVEPMVRRCIELKAEVVAEDEFETTGRRAILNFGHTVAHAVEQAYGYEGMPHGFAVAIGMAVEARLGELLKITPQGVAAEVEVRLRTWGLPTWDDCLRDVDARLEVMRRDKKAKAGRLSFSLLERIGACKLVHDVDESAVRSVMA
jgi:3-dehydroquinate synthase